MLNPSWWLILPEQSREMAELRLPQVFQWATHHPEVVQKFRWATRQLNWNPSSVGSLSITMKSEEKADPYMNDGRSTAWKKRDDWNNGNLRKVLQQTRHSKHLLRRCRKMLGTIGTVYTNNVLLGTRRSFSVPKNTHVLEWDTRFFCLGSLCQFKEV